MLHGILIALHASTGLLALVFGAVALRKRGFFDVYLGSLAGMTVFLGLAVAVEWSVLDTGARVLFGAFALLAAVMVGRGVLARRARGPAYLAHIGFTLVALFDAFVVVAVLDLGAPIWLVVGAGVLIAAAGHVVLRRAAQPSRSTPTAPAAPEAQQAPSRPQSTVSKLPS
jgi:hypothetical protein